MSENRMTAACLHLSMCVCIGLCNELHRNRGLPLLFLDGQTPDEIYFTNLPQEKLAA